MTKKEILSSDLVICFEAESFKTVSDLVAEGGKLNLQMMAEYHPESLSEIPDPITLSDHKSYEICYWMVYKAVRELVKKLKEEVRPKRIKVHLPDPTIFTITSPSSWQKNKLQSPDIQSPYYVQPPSPSGSVFTIWSDPKLSPPENPTETEDKNNSLHMKQKYLTEHDLNFEDVKVIPPSNIEALSSRTISQCYQGPISSSSVPPISVWNLLPLLLLLFPPQLDLEMTTRWPTPPPVYKGGDLFDDVRRFKSSWRR